MNKSMNAAYIFFKIVISCIGLYIYVCLRLSEGYSCVIHLDCCWREVTELAHRAWKETQCLDEEENKKIK